MKVIYIRDESGNFVSVPALKGLSGTSPTIEVTPIEGGNKLTITDVNGTKTVDIMDGNAVYAEVDDVVTTTGTNAVSGAAVATYVAQEISNAEVPAHNQSASTITAGTFAGAVVAPRSSQTTSTYMLRNSRLASSDTNPTYNGEICWTYS